MTPKEIQRTMDFILRIEANSVIRMERWQERFETWQEKVERWQAKFEARDAIIQREIRSLTRENREFTKSQRRYEKRLRVLEERDRRTNRRVDGIQQSIRILTRLAEIQSKRLDELQKNHG